MGMGSILLVATLAVLALLPSTSMGDVELTHISTAYLPPWGGKKPALFSNAVEQIAYDPNRKLIYVAGERILHVLNATNPADLALEVSLDQHHDDFTDIDLCGGRIFLTARNITDPPNSYLRIYESYDMERQDPLELVLETEGMT
ncbi:mesenchyme-specific cell surface glycoprotein [Elysia marginata]|uniref:Mesenchyme-specific cell surface glycoprotein n=1 Tax=Elysia marginata TaxID=1093978 RepID=A0AAV4FSG2_9GAST|nr:mesenchyme-specific cell surface glycoprotein [Elysia marginata]